MFDPDRKLQLDVSLFERLVTHSKLPAHQLLVRPAFCSKAASAALRMGLRAATARFVLVLAADAALRVQKQRRMRPAIADLIRNTIYPDLQDAACVQAYPDVAGGHACRRAQAPQALRLRHW